MRQSEWISAELHGTGSEAYDEPARPECTESKVEIERDMLRLMRISRLVDRKLGCQFVRRETDLVRRTFLAPVLERG